MTDDEWNELKNLAARLLQLLDAPEPGLITWNMAVAQVIQKIAAFAGLK